MKTRANYQKDALQVLRTRLNPDDPANDATDDVKAHLRALGLWLGTWVKPAIDAIDSRRGHEQHLRRAAIAEARAIRQRRRKINFDKAIDKRE